MYLGPSLMGPLFEARIHLEPIPNKDSIGLDKGNCHLEGGG